MTIRRRTFGAVYLRALMWLAFVKNRRSDLTIQCSDIKVSYYGDVAVVTGRWDYTMKQADNKLPRLPVGRQCGRIILTVGSDTHFRTHTSTQTPTGVRSRPVAKRYVGTV